MRRLSRTLQTRRSEIEAVVLPSRESGLQAYACSCNCSNCGCHPTGSNGNNDAALSLSYGSVMVMTQH